MANTILKADRILSTGIAVLERQIVLPGLVASDASQYFSGRSPKNDTVSIRVEGRTVAKDKPWRDKTAAIEISDLNEFKVDVKLDTHPYNAIELTDEELTLDIETFAEQVILPQTRSVAERIEDKIAAGISGAAYPTGSNITFGQTDSFYDALVDARKILNDYHVPAAQRVCLVGTAIEAQVLKDDQFKKFDQAGDNSALRDATLGRVAGFTVVTSPSIDPNEAFVFHPSAFQAVYRVPATPLGGVTTASGSNGGVAMRWVQDYDSTHMVNRSVFDTFFGFSVVTDPDDYTDSASPKTLKRAVKLTLDTDVTP
ncbi:P22 phage major capsid protein family protein [Rhodococcus pyridinivorans]|uniref:P22 phage major capsid protein family protein n=1 Tax=Rhodococcus pyridinivorans TaxID=103816 RepID=UPI003D7F8A0E